MTLARHSCNGAALVGALCGLLLSLQLHAMPPLPAERSAVYEYYKLAWLADGYPGRRTQHGVVAHPLYGTYVIGDYLRQWRATGKQEYLHAARKVADAGIARMERIENGLVFYYKPNVGLSSLPNTFYSALTQARWLHRFDELNRATKASQYEAAAGQVLNSLRIPVERGGVLKQLPNGVALQEYPHTVTTYTLNGWMTAMIILNEYEGRWADQANELFKKNLDGLLSMLPLYDVPEIANSRYQL